MIKAKLAIFAFLFICLAMVSAADFELTVIGDGNSSTNPISGASESTNPVSISLNFSNSTLGEATITWSGGSGYLTLPAATNISNGTHTYTPTLTLPSTTTTSYRTLTATFHNSSNLSQELGSDLVNIYYNSTAAEASDPEESQLMTLENRCWHIVHALPL